MVALDAATTTALAKHRLTQASERSAWGEAAVDTNLVFTREDGAALRPEYVTQAFCRMAAEAALPPIRLHDLRHTNASLALAAGVPLKVVSQRLGHSTTSITSNLYTHVIPSVAREAADRIAALVADRPALPNVDVPRPMFSESLAQDPQTTEEVIR